MLIELLAFGGAGWALGLAYFATLRANARLYLEPRALWWPIALNLVRLGTAGVALTAAAAFGGALPLLASLVGFMLARTAMMRIARSAS